MSAFSTMAGRIGRHAAIYGSGSLLTLAFGLIQLAVLTRFLDTGEFGQFAVFLVFSALLTVVYNAGSLQGSFSWVFGSTGEEEIQDEEQASGAGDKRRALGSALVLTGLIAATGTTVLALLAPQVSYLVIGSEDRADLVVWAAVSGGLGSVWRLASNVLRLERRPVAYVVVAATRPVFILGLAIPLVATGGGAEGALAGVALGTAASLAVTLLTVRKDFRPALQRVDVVNIFRLGGVWIPTVISLWVLQQADLLLLAQYAPESEVGMYRVASRVGAVMSYLIGAFLMAWGSLSVDPISAAVEQERGRKQAGATLATYFALACITGLLALAVFSDVLVRIAPPDYAEAAPLIPLIGLGFVVYGAFVVVYRTASLPNGRRTYIVLTVVSAVAFLAAALLMIPMWGSYGAALAVVVGPAAGTAVMLALSQRREDRTPIEFDRILAAVALGGACLALAKLGGPLTGEWQPAVELLAFAVFPALLVATGVVPRRHVRGLAAVFRMVVGPASPARDLRRRVHELDAPKRKLLDELVREKRRPGEVADSLGKDESELLAEFVGTLRRLGGIGRPSAGDERIGAYLLSDASVAERNATARTLWTSDADPLEVDSLTLVLQALAREGRWPRARRKEAAARLVRDSRLRRRLMDCLTAAEGLQAGLLSGRLREDDSRTAAALEAWKDSVCRVLREEKGTHLMAEILDEPLPARLDSGAGWLDGRIARLKSIVDSSPLRASPSSGKGALRRTKCLTGDHITVGRKSKR